MWRFFAIFGFLREALGVEFTSIEPVIVSVFGGNTLTITGTGYLGSVGEDIVCEWESAFVVGGTYPTSTTIECPVPSIFRFSTFSATSTGTLTDLKVSFSTDDAPSAVVLGVESSLSLLYRTTAEELAAITVSPRQSLATFASTLVTITGLGFPTSLPAGHVFCRFVILGSTGQYSSALYVAGTVVSATSLTCTAPTLAAIDTTASAPVDAVVQVSFDGQQTFSFGQAGFAFIPAFVVGSISPTQALDSGGTTITLTGTNFLTTPFLKCRFRSIGEDPVRELDAATTTFVSSTAIRCTFDMFDPVIAVGTFSILITIDDVNYVETGFQIPIVVAPSSATMTPSRGYYSGGTVVTISGSGIVDSPSTRCQFGEATVFISSFIDSTSIECRAPSCVAATGFSGEPEACSGTVSVAIVYGDGGGDISASPLSFTYVVLQRIHSFDPWPGSGWGSTFETKIFGLGFSNPLYCQWADLPSVLASEVGAVEDPPADGIDSYAICRAPSLPEEYRPAAVTGLDFLQVHVEVSPNDQDWTRDRRQWFFYEPPVVESVFPSSVWRETVGEGGMFITGNFFRKISTESLSCLWYFDYPDEFEVVAAEFVDRSTIKCVPTEEVVASAEFVRVEVSMTPNVFSQSQHLIDATQRPIVVSVNPVTGPYLGGTEVEIVGQFLYTADEDVYVVVGDVPVLATKLGNSGLNQVLSILTPPVPHWTLTPASFALSIAVNAHDRFTYETENFLFASVPAGSYWAGGAAVVCPSGFFCGGGYSANDTIALTSVVAPNACPPGAFQPASGTSGCFACTVPGFCPSAGQTVPSHCKPGLVCWGSAGGFDASAPYCPMGKVCLIPEELARPIEIDVVLDPFSQYGQSSTAGGGLVGGVGAGGSRRLMLEGSDVEGIFEKYRNGKNFKKSQNSKNSQYSQTPSSVVIKVSGSSPSSVNFTWVAGESEPVLFGRRLAADDPLDGVEIVDCDAGRFCPPGSVGTNYGDGLVVVDAGIPHCSVLGTLCAEGSAGPFALDVTAAVGFYISPDGASTIECPIGYACSSGSRNACPGGTFESEVGAGECVPCSAGTICPVALRPTPQLCPRGRVCSLPGRYAATYLCPAGSYCLFGTITLSTVADAEELNMPHTCPLGTYCLPGTNAEIADLGNPSAPRACAVGFYCGVNETNYQGRGPCPIGNYCVLGSADPVPAPKGYYVDYTGAYAPSRCPPGFYQDEEGQSDCKTCLEGYECPVDGLEAPILCAAGHYRSNSDPFYTQLTDNVNCHPCPEGTWNWESGLTSSERCITCPERYVCARQGMTVFALKNETDCTPNANGVALCYSLSQANDCPEGYACDAGTTSFTQYDFPCEPGYYCKALTALREMRNLLCPAGYYCKQATGASKASSLDCPASFYCPEGTAEIDKGGNTRTLYNVQATFNDPVTGEEFTTHVNVTDPTTGASCRNCDPDLFTPPLLIDTTDCVPCGMPQVTVARRLEKENFDEEFASEIFLEENFKSISRGEKNINEKFANISSFGNILGKEKSLPHGLFGVGLAGSVSYVPITLWASLVCPDGTTSVLGSGLPGDCVQEGFVLAVVNIYDRNAVVVNSRTLEVTAMWDPEREVQWVDVTSAAYAAKTTLMFGKPVSSTNSYIVDFLGYDPRDGPSIPSDFHFVSLQMDALDILTLRLDFSQVPAGMLMATEGNPGGHYKLTLASDKVTGSEYILPFTISEGSGSIHELFTLKMLALMDSVKVNVSIALVHGSHYSDLHFFNDAVTLTLESPNKTDYGNPKSFYAVTSAALLNNGGYELPYNMIPTMANQPGDLSLVVDLGGQLNYTVDSSLKSKMIPGTTFWQVAGASTVVTPWLPFFSNCDYFDKHIVIWDLLERGDQLPAEAGACKLFPESEVRVVAPLVYDFANVQMQFQADADYCELAFRCRYEDNLAFSGADPVPWMAIPGTTTLFYLTQDPLWFADVGAPDFQTSIGALDGWEGTDNLIPVVYDASTRTGSFPRLIHLQIDYAQVTTTSKRIVQAALTLTNFDDDATRTDYTLQISWEPMNWIDMMNAFQLPMYVYAVVFVLIGFAAVGAAILAWGILQLATKSSRIPPFRILDCYHFFMNYATQGVVVGSIPPMFVAGLIKGIMLNKIDPFASVACAWAKGSSSTASVLVSGTDDAVTCQAVRTGTCLIMAGVFILWSASLYFSPRLPEDHKEYLVSAGARKLQDDGIFFPAKKRFAAHIIETTLKWKRIHIFFVAILVTLPLMTLFAFSYSDMFGSFTTFYTIGYMLTMLMADLLFVKVAREKLMFNALAVVTDVVYFVATLSAQDLNAFISSFLFQQFFTVAQRLIAEKVIAYAYESAIPNGVKWIRSRKVVWGFVLAVSNFTRLVRRQAPRQVIGGRPILAAPPASGSVEIPVLKYTEARKDKLDTNLPLIDNEEIENIDENADQTMGVAGRTLSLIFSPFAILLLVIFPTETMFPANYGLRLVNIPYYLLFSILIIPFQIGLDLVINHGYDASLGTRIYDYMYLCQWRWKNRLTRWLLDDARLDSSIGQSTQALHHLCFSPQFYFIVTYAISGGLFVTYGITCWIVHGVPAFVDPVFGYYVIVMFLATRVADAIARWLVFYVMWKPADRAPERAFIQSIALGLKQKELEEHQLAFRNFFFKRHREWIIGNLDKVYTPRGMEKYRTQISDIYQRVLTTKIPYLYTAPPKELPPIAVEKPKDDTLADIATRQYLSDTDMHEVPLSGDEDGMVAPQNPSKKSSLASAFMSSWFQVARRRLESRGDRPFTGIRIEVPEPPVGESVEVFPDWVVVNISNGSRQMIARWLQLARERIQGSRGNVW